MIAFHGDPTIKATYLTRVRHHRQMDEIVQGVYYETDGPKPQMCSIGCTIHGSSHDDYARELGIPLTLVYLNERIFESLPARQAQIWPERFLSAIPVGADLDGVGDQFILWLLTDDGYNVGRFSEESGKRAIDQVASLYRRKIAGDTILTQEWEAARAAAEAAADSATRSATRSAAEAAAEAAAWLAARAAAEWAARAAESAARASGAAAESAAEAAAWEHIADHLLVLVAAAPTHACRSLVTVPVLTTQSSTTADYSSPVVA